MFKLIHIYFLSIRRSSLFDTMLVTEIFSFFIFGYLYSCFFILGFFLDKILMAIEPGVAPIDTFSYFFLFLFVGDIILKFFFKSYIYVDVLPYLTLPITRKKIYILLFIKELFSKWNFIWVVLLTPFFIKTIYPVNGLASTLLLIFSIYLLSLMISSVVRYVNILFAWKPFMHTFSLLLVTICVGYAAYYIAIAPKQLIDINLLFSQYKTETFIVLVLLFSGLFVVFLKFCRYEVYLLLNGKEKSAITLNLSWFNKFGVKGEIFNLCLMEVVRSLLKRTIMYAIVFLIVGLYLLKNGNFLVQCCIALLPTILIGKVYGENTFNVESTFFDRLMVSPNNIPYLIIKSKYIICVIHAAFNTIISIAICINRISILFWISTFFFGCGFLLFFTFQNVIYNKQRSDILGSVRRFSDFKIPYLLLITLSIGLVVVTIKGLTSEIIAEYVMLITGIVGIATSTFWLKNIYNRFLDRKYQNMNGFRNG